jgi:hypothetical protein
MNITKYLFLFIMLICQNSFAQKQNNQWRFGFGGALDFNTLPPSFVNGCVIAASEGSASVADRVTGALLFYTDGVTVWNANNQIMPNGTGLLGGVTLSSTTAAVIVPKPGSSNLYYIITVDEFTSNNGVRYSVVDMTLNGGLGDIVAGQKNIFLFQTNEERLEVIPASESAASTTGTIFCICALLANSGTTPPYCSWIFWVAIILDRIRPSVQTEALVSSQDDSMARR